MSDRTSAAGESGARKAPGATRERLLKAAAEEFARHGFEGTSTLAIAARADTHQPQINYYFGSKMGLWRAVLADLVAGFDAAMAGIDGTDQSDLLEQAIRALVEITAARPQFPRIMQHEAMAPSERLDWVVESVVRPRVEPLLVLWEAAVAAGEVPPIPSIVACYMIIGAVSQLHVAAAEVHRLGGIDPADPAIVAVQADAVVNLFLRPRGG